MPESIIKASDFKAIVFDLDGTLYTVSGLNFYMALEMPFEPIRLRALFKTRTDMRGTDYENREIFKAHFATKLGSRINMLPQHAIDWYEKKFMAGFINVLSKHGRLRNGLLPLLSKLRANGLRLAVVSDFGCVKERLSALGIPRDCFDEVLAAEDFGVMKPTAKPYLYLAELWKNKPSELLLIGDREDHDLGSAALLDFGFLGIESKQGKGPLFRKWPEVFNCLDS